jgi:hypothetical protein
MPGSSDLVKATRGLQGSEYREASGEAFQTQTPKHPARTLQLSSSGPGCVNATLTFLLIRLDPGWRLAYKE